VCRTSPLNEEQLDKQIYEREFDRRGHWKSTLGKWSVDPSTTLQNREFWRAFEECRVKLPPTLAATFVMREFEQLDTGSICDLLNISASNLSVRLYRARVLLRKCLERNWFCLENRQDE
jgi:RNA polymerase sigma-70 factor (ECF subfamily)